MHIQIPSAKAASGNRRSLRLIVPLPPRASPRACLEAQVDFLLEMLDRIDGDPDLEETGDLEAGADSEPSLGSLDRPANQTRWAFGDREDYELDQSDYEDGGDLELSLGWTNPLGAKVDACGQLVVERVPDRQVRA